MSEFQAGGRTAKFEADRSAGTWGDWPAVIGRRRGYLYAALIVALGVGVAYLKVAQPVYEIRARLLVQKQGVTLDASRAADAVDKDFLATQAQILRSPVIVRDAMAAVPPSYLDTTTTDPLTVLLESLSVDPVLGTNVLNVRLRYPDGEQGIHMVDAIIHRYREYTREETLRLLGRIGETPKIQESLWQAQVRAKELVQSRGPKHPELRAVQEQMVLWENLLEERRLADQALAEAQAAERVRVLEGPATEQPIWPRPALLLAVCAVIGLTGGLGLIWLVDRLDPTLRSPDDLKSRLHAPILGQIPVIAVPRRAGSDPLYRGRVVRELPDSPVADAFRGLRTHLQLYADSDRGQVIQIVSPCESEGKTTVTANLAFSFAQLGKRVAVVDADLRRGTLHRIFDVSPAKGLKAVLLDETPVDEALERSPLADVDVLSTGPKTANPVELLARRDFAKILKFLRQQYDVVLIDTAPLLATTDGWMLASNADGVLLSLVLGESLVADAVRACEQLDFLGARVLGVVINQVPESGRNGYYLTNGYHVSRSRPSNGELAEVGAGKVQ